MWIEALLISMRFLRTQVRNPKLEVQWASSLDVVLALSGLDKALQWLLSHIPRYSFCGICGNELEGLALVAQGQKSLFPHWPTLQHLFCCTQKGHLGGGSL